MAGHLFAVSIITLTLFTVVIHPSEARRLEEKGLTVGFYSKTCPKVENIVTEVVADAQKKDPKISPGLIRLLFHDCFVKGCDASVLLDKSLHGGPVEKASRGNAETLRGFEVIDEIKARLEKECPKTVSCADILAFAAREAVQLAGLPRHEVPAGRFDSKTSRAGDVDKYMPPPITPLEDLISQFATKGLSIEDMVVLSGVHSIGQSRCTQFRDRLYKYSKDVPRDPSLNKAYGDELAGKCPAPDKVPEEKAKLILVDFDPTTPQRLDNNYYKNLLEGKGLLQSDQVLTNDTRTKAIVSEMAANPDTWSKKFLQAMIKMGSISPLTKMEGGQVRTNCRQIL